VSTRSPALTGAAREPKAARRRLHPDARRAELLDAAIRVLRRRGPEACRVEDITQEAGTAKGNFYRYFPTWDDLLLAVRDHLLDSYQAELAQRYAGLSSVDWWNALDLEIERFIDFQLGLGGLHAALFHGRAASARPVEPDRSAVSILAGFLAAGVAEGAFAAVDVDAAAPLLFDVLHGAADIVAAGMDRGRALGAALQIVHRTLDPLPPGPRR
jgi:AcrR family transcriptional regulator